MNRETGSLPKMNLSSNLKRGSMFEAIAGVKPKRNVIEFVLGTLIVSVIYILANIMYLAVVPLYDIATAESDRVAVVASQILVLNIIAVMISTLPVTTD
jgi:hypothetical protein